MTRGVGRCGGSGAAAARSTRSRRGSTRYVCRLATGEEAVDARVDALRVGLGGRGGAVALVALGSTLVGCNGLAGVGTGVAQARSLAGNVSSGACKGAAHGTREARRHGGACRSACHRRILGNGEGADSTEENGGVLHGDGGGGCDVSGNG